MAGPQGKNFCGTCAGQKILSRTRSVDELSRFVHPGAGHADARPQSQADHGGEADRWQAHPLHHRGRARPDPRRVLDRPARLVRALRGRPRQAAPLALLPHRQRRRTSASRCDRQVPRGDGRRRGRGHRPAAQEATRHDRGEDLRRAVRGLVRAACAGAAGATARRAHEIREPSQEDVRRGVHLRDQAHRRGQAARSSRRRFRPRVVEQHRHACSTAS